MILVLMLVGLGKLILFVARGILILVWLLLMLGLFLVVLIGRTIFGLRSKRRAKPVTPPGSQGVHIDVTGF